MRHFYRLTLLSAFLAIECASGFAAQPKKVLVLNESPEQLRELQSASPKVHVIGVTKDTVTKELPDADAFVGEITSEQVRDGKNLKWVQIISAGVERALYPPDGGDDLRKSNIILTNNKIVQGPEIADHAMAMLLYLTRDLSTFAENKRQQNWRPSQVRLIELNGRTAVIIGVGGIGTQIAIRATAFGMNVIGVDPEDKPFVPFVKRFVKPDQLDEVLPEADVVFISTPLTPVSRKMMGARQFELLKPKAYFIAVSRGGIYDMNALVRGLDSQRLAGAGVDVTDPEPLPADHPLWKFPNVIITPHIAGRSDKDAARMFNTVKENIARFGDGRPLINVVDKQKGY
jgi:phosphoglycerate dehydrogenase-like enzyme